METTLTILKAVSDRNRLRILAALAGGLELCACQITELLRVTAPTVSRHLALLTRAGLISSRKEGRWIFFSISRQRDPLMFDWLIPKLEDSDQYRKDRLDLKDILAQNPEDICRKQRGEACCPVKEKK